MCLTSAGVSGITMEAVRNPTGKEQREDEQTS